MLQTKFTMSQNDMEMDIHHCGSQSMCLWYSVNSEDEAEAFQRQY